MQNSTIEWTDHSWNPWIGCTRVSPGCQHCYAETLMADRYKKVKWGPQGRRVRTSDAYWKQPLKWNREAAAEGVRRRVFCASLADVFEEKEGQNNDLFWWRYELWDLIEQTPNLDWLLLTKRPERVLHMAPFTNGSYINGPERPWPANLWIGTSIENREYADKRIPELLKIPAAVRFLSCEPLLGPIDLTSIELPNTGGHRVDVLRGGYWNKAGILFGGPSAGYGEPKGGFASHSDMPGVIDWVIAGAESGHGARTMNLDDARSLRDQCAAAGVKFFMKQVAVNGRKLPFDQFPEDLQIREFPR